MPKPKTKPSPSPAPSESRVVMPPPKMWEAIVKLRELRARAKAAEQDLIKARNKLKDDLERMGSTEKITATTEWRGVAANLKFVEIAIETARRDKDYYADKAEEAVDMAGQGRLFKDDEFTTIFDPRKEDSAPLFARAIESAGLPPDGTPEVGEPSKKRGGAKSPKDWRQATIASKAIVIPLSDEAIKSLADAGVLTLGDLNRFLDEGGSLKAVGLVGAEIQASIRYMDTVRTIDDPQHSNGAPAAAAGKGGVA